jgi:hypothetical protein
MPAMIDPTDAPAPRPIPPLPVERVRAGEREAILQMIDDLKRQLETDYAAPSTMRRDAHPKTHGLVDARVIIDPECPPELRHGLFQSDRPREYPAEIRLSNGNPKVRHDLAGDVRGFAIKLFVQTGGERSLFDDWEHDFLLATGDAFFGKDAIDFRDFPAAFVSPLRTLAYFLRRPRALLNFFKGSTIPASPLDATYFSQTPYRLGPHVVKYQARRIGVRPTDGDPRHLRPFWRRLIGLRVMVVELIWGPAGSRGIAGVDAMREALVADLRRGDVRYELLVQRWPDLSALPVWAIEDARRAWPLPWVRVATIVIPQVADASARNQEAERRSFNPGRTLSAHQALGSINRARTAIYREMSAFRMNENDRRRKP